jgi:uncharacterized membrane protein YoaK (UPF0700 family)
MFRQRGKARTFAHNFRLAAFLSFTAGMVNICGVLEIGVLTTNVTGHFAYFAENVNERDLNFGLNFLLYILSFLAGSFVSGLLSESTLAKSFQGPHKPAMFLEILLLVTIGVFGDSALRSGVNGIWLASVMLFAMGLQNALVTVISSAVVRTTHLTGLFTDLGIELSKLFYYKKQEEQIPLKRSIGLRLGIIAFFFLGCITGDMFFSLLRFRVLLIAVASLIMALRFDNFRINVYKIRKNRKS